MSKIRGTNTKPEILVRSLIHRLGYRFRLHRKELPGTPDLVFPGRRKVIFVNGCFWHWHQNCPEFRAPESRVEYWSAKFARNRRRDVENVRRLKNLGWRTLTIWECQLKRPERLEAKIIRFLGDE